MTGANPAQPAQARQFRAPTIQPEPGAGTTSRKRSEAYCEAYREAYCEAYCEAHASISELCQALLDLYRSRSATGTAGNEAMTLYLDAQDIVTTRPSESLNLAKKGLEILRQIHDDHRGQGGQQRRDWDLAPQADVPTAEGAAAENSVGTAGGSEPQTGGPSDKRLLSAHLHDILEQLYNSEAAETVLSRLIPAKPEADQLQPLGSLRRLAIPTELVREAGEYRRELMELVRWEPEEARTLISEAHDFVADRWLGRVREPYEAQGLWARISAAADRQNMGALRVALRKWVRAYAGEIVRAGEESLEERGGEDRLRYAGQVLTPSGTSPTGTSVEEMAETPPSGSVQRVAGTLQEPNGANVANVANVANGASASNVGCRRNTGEVA